MTPTVRWSLPINRRWVAGLVIWGAIAGALYSTGLGRQPVINPGGLTQALQFITASLHPNLSPPFLAIIAHATGVTLAYALCGTFLSLVIGLIGGLFSAEIWWQTLFPTGKTAQLSRLLWLGIRGLLAFPRAIHELIWGLFFLTILGLDPLVAILAIAIPFGAIVAKVFSEILDETPHEPLHALCSAGVAPLTALIYGLLPQALPNLLSYSFYRFECSLRSAAVLGVIGAGGLGYEIFLSLQSLHYDQLWTGFYALIGLNGAVDAGSAYVRRSMGFTGRLALNFGQVQSRMDPGQSQGQSRGIAPTGWGMGIGWSAIALAIPVCFHYLQVDWSRLTAARTQRLFAEVIADAKPDPLTWAQFHNLLHLSSQTLAMSVLAISLAGLLGILASFPAAQTLLLPGGILNPLTQQSGRSQIAAWVTLGGSRLLLLVSRAIPAPIWALVILFLTFPGILPGAIALGLHNFGILGRLMAEANENLDDRPVRSLQALGAPTGSLILYGLLPQNLPSFMAYILYRWEVCMRETVIVGLVGAGGLGRLMTEQLSSFDYAGLTLTLGAFVILAFGVDLISASLRQALR